MRTTRRLLAILGRRTFLTFGLVTFLVAALLATVNLTSRYALKLYVDDQLRRTPWDVSVYQKGAARHGLHDLPVSLSGVDGVTRVESVAFLRARFPETGEVVSEVDGNPIVTPWLCLLSASDLSILPPDVNSALRREGGASGDGAVLALVGPQRSMGQAFLALQGARQFDIKVQMAHGRHDLFATPIRGVVRLDRDELNRWLMDQTGSVSFVPHTGIVLLMSYRPDVLDRFDSVATGIVPPDVLASMGPNIQAVAASATSDHADDHGGGEHEHAAPAASQDPGHVQRAEYAPEMMYLARFDRDRVISGWDIAGSLQRVGAINDAIKRAAETGGDEAFTRNIPKVPQPAADVEQRVPMGLEFFVDSTTHVLLGRMERIARLVGLVSLLVALPLLWMTWVLAGNLSGLLMLNERRTLGLMRLRGVPAKLLSRALVLAVVGGGLAGGLGGLVVGTIVPLLIYERGGLPGEVLFQPQQAVLFLAFLAITLVLALVVSRRFIRYATTISPLEASRQVAASEAAHATPHFGVPQLIALVVGAYVLLRWVFGLSLAALTGRPALDAVEPLLDFLGLPLFLYGFVTLLASRRAWIQTMLAPVIRPFGGTLGHFAQRHVAVKPHRTMAFLLIVALMGSVSLYPMITGGSFSNRAERGARVQLGGDWQFIFNAPDLADVAQLKGDVAAQLAALRPGIDRVVSSVANAPGVSSATYLIEGVLPDFYLPGYGLRGVPIYLLGNADSYFSTVYAEPQVGVTDPFDRIADGVRAGKIVASPSVAEFWELKPDAPVQLGMDAERNAVTAGTAGVLAFLPGLPPRSVQDRQGYVQARVDYLNYLFSSSAYLAGAADERKVGGLEILIPRVIVIAKAARGVDPAAMQAKIIEALPIPPLEVHNVSDEIGKVGSDMYIALALANMRIYVLGGLGLALIAIIAIGLVNHREDRRTLALLRVRGASPQQLWRLLVAMLLSPALMGLVVGIVVALVAGYGLANQVWKLREIRTVVQLLPTRLVVPALAVGVTTLIVLLLFSVSSAFSWWEYRKTAREGVQRA